MLIRSTLTNYFQRIHRFAALIALFIYLSIAADLNLQPLGKGIYNRCAYAVQTAGYLVSAAAELAARMQDRKYDLNRRKSRLFLDVNRNATTVILYRDRIVRIDLHLNVAAVSSERLVHGVVYYLIHQVMEASYRCAAYIHTRTLSDRLQSLQYLYLICTVF